MSESEELKSPPDGKIGTEKIRRKMKPLLTAWYGESEDSCVMMNYLPKTKNIGELMDELGESLYPKNMYVLTQIQSSWPEIVGFVAAKNTRPLFLNDRILKIELSHPAYLMSLNSKRVKDGIVKKINSMFEKDVCDGILFVPKGRGGDLARKDINEK